MKKILWGCLIFLFCAPPVFYPEGMVLAAYPEKPVTLICVWGVGGNNDAIARKIADMMKTYFPKPMVVVNRAGGAGTVGTAEIVSAKPDGYTIGTTTMSPLTIKPHQMALPYRTPDDYIPITLVGNQAISLGVSNDSPFKTLKDLVEYAKTNPSKLRINTGGIGHISHLILEQLKFLAKIDVTDVPFPGGGEQIAAVLGKHTEGALVPMFDLYPQVQAGKIRILAVSDQKRRALCPGVPTFKEIGYDITIITYTLIIGPKGMAKEAVTKIQEAFKKVAADPAFIKFMEEGGFTVQYEETANLRKMLWKDYNDNKNIFERINKKGPGAK